MADTWESASKKTKGHRIIAAAVVVFLFIGVLVINNFDFFLSKKDNDNPPSPARKTEVTEGMKNRETDKMEAPVATRKYTVEKNIRNEPPQTVSPVKKDKDAAKPVQEQMLSVELTAVNCLLAERKPLAIDVSLKLHFKGKNLENEILFKRDNIKILVKKVFCRKYLTEIIADPLRAELKKEINAALEQGQISDIEFINFTPVE